jgi:hypothetical protein
VIEGTVLEIARFLAGKGGTSSRTTYEQVAGEIGWSRPTGRGLAKYLYEVMHYCKEQSLPPLTLETLVQTRSRRMRIRPVRATM